MKDRDFAQALATASTLECDWSKYKLLRNRVTNRLKVEKRNWEKQKLDQVDNNSGKLWSTVKGWLNWSNATSPTKLFNAGLIETSPQKMATIMNNFYIEKVCKIRDNLSDTNVNPLLHLQQLRSNSDSVFRLKSVHPDLVYKIIGGLKNSKSTGLDNIDTNIVKLVRNEVTPSLTHIVNLSIQTSTFPELWKHAKVVPLLKPGSEDLLAPKSYRPVALLPVLSKVLERVVFLQTVQYMNDHKLMHPNHHGFRSQHSTTTAMLQLYDSWVDAANRGELAGVVMIDQSAAFDCVDHSLLLSKLKLYGWDDNALAWSKTYLENRRQSCSVESFLSESLPVLYGVPQGSILGPLYYCIFTNDFPESIHHQDCPCKTVDNFSMECRECGSTVVYADDSTFTVTGSDPDLLSSKLSEKFTVMADYLTANKLKVNNDKTHLMLMCTSQRQRQIPRDFSMLAENYVVRVSESERLLGAYIQSNMKWLDHVRNNRSSVLQSLNKRHGALKKIASVASFKSRLTIANGIFMSKLVFMIPLWAGCSDYLVKALQICQNDAARTVTKHGRYVPVQKILKECGWRSVKQEMVYHSVLMIHKILIQKSPSYLHSRLTADGSYYYRTRQADTSSIRQSSSFQTSLSLCKDSFRWRGVSHYEQLPHTLREIGNIGLFKKKLDCWVKENIPTT